MRILHTADIHLSPVLGFLPEALRLRRRLDILAKVQALPGLVQEHGAEAVILAGDIFDRDDPWHPDRAELSGALGACGVPVLITPGTHDPVRPGRVWDNAWPANVHIFREPGWSVHQVQGAEFLGMPINGQAAPGGSVFASLPARSGSGVRIGIVHGACLWPDLAQKVSAADHPFLVAEGAGADLDYLALGNHHGMRLEASARLAYPGSPEGLGFSPAELGPRHMLLVEVATGRAPVFEPVRTDSAQMLAAKFELSHVPHHAEPGEVQTAIETWIREQAGPTHIARLLLEGEAPPAPLPASEALVERLGSLFLHLEVEDRSRASGSDAGARTVYTELDRRLREQERDADPHRLLILAEARRLARLALETGRL